MTSDNAQKFVLQMESRNVDLHGHYLRAVIEKPFLFARVATQRSVLVLLPANDSELAKWNRQLGLDALAEGKDVVFIHWPIQSPVWEDV